MAIAMDTLNLLYLLPLIVSLMVAKTTEAQVLANTTCGPVQGISKDGAFSFRGIPYAVPPVGNLRWRMPGEMTPETKTCWNGTYQATQFGSECYQRNPFNQSQNMGSEDCLFLNVWTPTLESDAKKPVMVWLHGGSLQQANANWPLYSPTETLARDTDIVYVGMNYRLQAFGFMALQLLADDSETKTSGNYGFLDMVLALKWVQKNIQNFGGDPEQVTLFGQSSGGTAILALISSPLCKGLFHKVWILSGSPVYNKTAADTFKDNQVFLDNTECTSVGCLRSLTSAEVTSAVPWDVYPYWAMTDQADLPVKGVFDGAICIVDGYLLTEPPFDVWKHGNQVDVPVMIGTMANEFDFDPRYLDMNTWTWDQYETHVRTKLETFGGDIADTAINLYPRNVTSPEYQFTRITADMRATCGNDYMANIMSDTFESPIYRYVVDYWPSKPISVFGMPFPSSYSFHIWDCFAFLGSVPNLINDATESDLQYQANVQKEMLSFVRSGHPSTPSWKTFLQNTAVLNTVTNTTPIYKQEECNFWLGNGFFSYALIN